MHWNGHQRLPGVLHRRLHVFVVAESAARHDDPLGIEAVAETSLELVESPLEQDLLRHHLLAVKIYFTVVDH